MVNVKSEIACKQRLVISKVYTLFSVGITANHSEFTIDIIDAIYMVRVSANGFAREERKLDGIFRRCGFVPSFFRRFRLSYLPIARIVMNVIISVEIIIITFFASVVGIKNYCTIEQRIRFCNGKCSEAVTGNYFSTRGTFRIRRFRLIQRHGNITQRGGISASIDYAKVEIYGSIVYEMSFYVVVNRRMNRFRLFA